MSKSLFVTGTGTDVGKTYIVGLMVKKLAERCQPAYFKAAMSGNERRADGFLLPGDAISVRTVSGIDQPLEEMCPYVYEAAVSPHLAAKWEGNPVDPNRVLRDFDQVCQTYPYVTAEGSGGILCPLRWGSQSFLLADFIRSRNLPCVIVADAGLGTINAVVLTVEYMKSHQLRPKGIILNRYQYGDPMHEDNRRMCEQLTELPVLACVADGEQALPMSFEELESLYEPSTKEVSL